MRLPEPFNLSYQNLICNFAVARPLNDLRWVGQGASRTQGHGILTWVRGRAVRRGHWPGSEVGRWGEVTDLGPRSGGVSRMTQVTIRELTRPMTSREIRMPRQFRWVGVAATSSCQRRRGGGGVRQQSGRTWVSGDRITENFTEKIARSSDHEESMNCRTFWGILDFFWTSPWTFCTNSDQDNSESTTSLLETEDHSPQHQRCIQLYISHHRWARGAGAGWLSDGGGGDGTGRGRGISYCSSLHIISQHASSQILMRLNNHCYWKRRVY